jgi:hypothetical protein
MIHMTVDLSKAVTPRLRIEITTDLPRKRIQMTADLSNALTPRIRIQMIVDLP